MNGAERGSRVSGEQSSRHSQVSLASVVSAARLKGEKDKAGLEARMAALKKKKDVEVAKAKLRIEEEELGHRDCYCGCQI